MTQANSDSGQELLKALMAAKIISQAQADLAEQDSQNMSMSLDEVLLARRWVSEEALKEHAPWLFKSSQQSNQDIPAEKNSGPVVTEHSGSSDDYGTNLARYRSLMRDILGQEG